MTNANDPHGLFSGVWLPLITPFRGNAVDHTALARLVQHYCKTLLQLAGHPNIRAVKDCGQDAAKTHALVADGRLAVLAGDDLQLFSTVALGGAGAIAASAHVHTERFVAVIRLLQRGALNEARAAWMPLVPVIEAMFAEPNPASIKAALARDGWIANELRAPMMPPPLAACYGREKCNLRAVQQRGRLICHYLVLRHAQGFAARKAVGIGLTTGDQVIAQTRKGGGCGVHRFAVLAHSLADGSEIFDGDFHVN
jgi:dihydrodipicolinate synthase/N-acetylneuraminate lyase